MQASAGEVPTASAVSQSASGGKRYSQTCSHSAKNDFSELLFSHQVCDYIFPPHKHFRLHTIKYLLIFINIGLLSVIVKPLLIPCSPIIFYIYGDIN